MSAGSLWNQICEKGSDKKCDYLTGSRQKIELRTFGIKLIVWGEKVGNINTQ